MDLMDDFIKNEYENVIQKNKSIVYGSFKNACEEKGYHPPSLQTFCLRIEKRPIDKVTEERQGKRAKYQKDVYFWELEMTTPRHGDYPFNIGHLDHTELDIELICSRTGKNLGKPYLTLLIDAFSRKVLAFSISYNPPSTISCMMVFRDCVRRYSRLPQIIVVDNGKEFHSVYFETLLAMYQREPKRRPPAQPRYGSVLERLFGTTNSSIIHNLEGNTKIMKNVRMVTKSVNPKNHAKWSLPELSIALEEFFFELYETTEHPALEQSPREAFQNGLFYSGERKNALILYDKVFEILSLPSTPHGEATIQQNGVKINYIYYWNNEFKNLVQFKTKVKVRFDPFNIGVAYAFVNKRWIKCTSSYYTVLSRITLKELKFVTAEIKKGKQNHGKVFSVTAQRIASFIQNLHNNEQFSLIKARADEGKKVIQLRFDQGSYLEEKEEILTDTIENYDNHSFDKHEVTSEHKNTKVSNLEVYGDF